MLMNLIDPRDPAYQVAVERKVATITSGILRTVWDFAQQKPSAVYVCLDLASGDAGAMVALGSRLVRVEELGDLPAPFNFDSSEERLASLKDFIRSDSDEIIAAMRNAKLQVPDRIWMAQLLSGNVKRSVFGYGGGATSVDSRMSDWAETLRSAEANSLAI